MLANATGDPEKVFLVRQTKNTLYDYLALLLRAVRSATTHKGKLSGAAAIVYKLPEHRLIACVLCAVAVFIALSPPAMFS